MRKSAESVEGVVDSAKPNNGSTRSSRKINGVDGFRVCRRSPRFLAMANTPEISDKKNLGVSGFGSCGRSPRVLVMENTPEVVKEKICGKMSNGSKMSVRKIDGCRRSPRLAAMESTPGGKLKIGLDKSSKKMDEIEGLRGGGRASSRSSRFVSVIGSTPEICDTKTGLDMGNDQLICGGSVDVMNSKEALSKGVRNGASTKRGRKALEVMSSMETIREAEGVVVTPKGKVKKKRNVGRGNNENLGTSEDPRSHQEVEKTSFTHLRTPLCSIENISPMEKQMVGGGKNPKKLVVSQKALIGSVKSMCGLKKKTEESPIGNQCGVRGWTKEQELALQRAYFAAKPSPHIWKRISKLVPGKSAQDCFDRIQSKSITPLSQPRRRSRTNKTNSPSSSPLCLTGSKLLEPATKLNVKKPRGTKRLAQKTARHLLQKQNLANQGYKKDLFSILEPTVSTSIQSIPEATSLFTPECKQGGKDFLFNYHQRSFSSHKSPLSRCKDSTHVPRVAPSPAVLKQVKDMSVHEKYIDQLHSREAKRKTGSRRQQLNGKEDRKEGIHKQDSIKAAKNALVSDASDMIKKFQDVQASMLDSCDDLYDVAEDSAGEDEEC